MSNNVRIKTALVLGGGSTGVNVAAALSRADISVMLLEPDEGTADRARHYLGRSDRPVEVLERWRGSHNVDLVFDAAQEDEGLRAGFFRELKDAVSALMVLATTRDLQNALPSTPDDLHACLLGFRLSEPSHLRRLVEIEVGTQTHPAVANAAFDLARALGKYPISVSTGQRSINTRLQDCLSQAAEELLLFGAIPHELDEAMVAFGFDLGPCEAQDLIGLDVVRSQQRPWPPKSGQRQHFTPISDRMIQEGRLGKKVGVGWYRYPGGGGAVIDPLIEDLVREEARFADVLQRGFCPEQIQNELLLTLFREGSAILAEGGVAHASDIDSVSVHGLGFPENRVGIMSYGSEIDCWVK